MMRQLSASPLPASSPLAHAQPPQLQQPSSTPSSPAAEEQLLAQCPRARIVSFTSSPSATASSFMSPPSSKHIVSERNVARGSLKIYRIAAHNSTFIQCGSAVHPILKRLRCWQIKRNEFILPLPTPGTYLRLEIESTDDALLHLLETNLARSCRLLQNASSSRSSSLNTAEADDDDDDDDDGDYDSDTNWIEAHLDGKFMDASSSLDISALSPKRAAPASASTATSPLLMKRTAGGAKQQQEQQQEEEQEEQGVAAIEEEEEENSERAAVSKAASAANRRLIFEQQLLSSSPPPLPQSSDNASQQQKQDGEENEQKEGEKNEERDGTAKPESEASNSHQIPCEPTSPSPSSPGRESQFSFATTESDVSSLVSSTSATADDDDNESVSSSSTTTPYSTTLSSPQQQSKQQQQQQPTKDDAAPPSSTSTASTPLRLPIQKPQTVASRTHARHKSHTFTPSPPARLKPAYAVADDLAWSDLSYDFNDLSIQPYGFERNYWKMEYSSVEQVMQRRRSNSAGTAVVQEEVEARTKMEEQPTRRKWSFGLF